VQRHAHLDRIGQRPGFLRDDLLRANGGGKRVGRGGESGLHAVADGLVAIAAVLGYGGIEQLEMALDRGRHGLTIPLPEGSAALDVGEEEGDSSRRKIGHGPLHGCGSSCF
jgi:hypothetical protein